MSALPSQYQEYIHISRYSRYSYELGRREIWSETVRRYVDFLKKHTNGVADQYLDEVVYPAIVNLESMPSMRALMTAGPALEREHLAAYNCAYVAVNNKRAFSEALYILMCGTGVGFSCERQEIGKLPAIPDEIKPTEDVIVVGDSKEGWAKAFKKLVSSLWDGDLPTVDFSKVRPAGSVLKTFGGRASGPEPLKRLFVFVTEVFKKAVGRKLNSLEVHDIMCVIGEIVVVGGVRRSALISLSNLSDQRMRDAKSGQWWETQGQRALSNNSVAYTEKPSAEIFLEEWLSLVKSKSGERGIFNRVAAQKQAAKYGKRSKDIEYGCNPCSEIILRDKQLCNLTEVVIREKDTLETVLKKIEVATVLGTIQATFTNFNFVGDTWIKNTQEERLLGVSLTGIMDHEVFSGKKNRDTLKKWLGTMREHARKVNKEWAELLDIKESAAITCVKPSGTVSQLVDSSSGIHTRHSDYYLRTVRVDKKDPLYTFMVDKGIYHEDERHHPESTAVFSFPVKSPKHSVKDYDLSAIDQLEMWLIYQQEWCEHKPSVTIRVKENEWLKVGAWVYEYFDEISGIAFIPSSDHTYVQAPYQELTKEEFYNWIEAHPMPIIDWTELSKYEDSDRTEGSQTLACSSGTCEIL